MVSQTSSQTQSSLFLFQDTEEARARSLARKNKKRKRQFSKGQSASRAHSTISKQPRDQSGIADPEVC